MTESRRRFLFTGVLLLLALVAAGEAWGIFSRVKAMRAVGRKLVRQRTALARLAIAAPAPSRENATRIESDLARVQRTLAIAQGELLGRGPAADRLQTAQPPALRTDAFFDLAAFAESARARAKQQGIGLAHAANSFGFSLYATEGPETALIAPVFRQRLVIQHLIDALFGAHPRSLLSVQRERPLSADERKARAGVVTGVAQASRSATAPARVEAVPVSSPDYFVPEVRPPANAYSIADVSAFRLVFTGQTGTLRAFLNQLTGFELPVIVRAIEVEPASSEDVIENEKMSAASADISRVPHRANPAALGKAAAETVAGAPSLRGEICGNLRHIPLRLF